MNCPCKKITFRKVKDPEQLQRVIKFLKEDVDIHGGTCGEVIDLHGKLWDIQASFSPWGTIIIRKEVSKLEAIALWFSVE